jgi:hypothetical protein
LIIGALAVAACSGPTTTLSPAAEGARTFRPVGALFFLPEKAPAAAIVEADLVPDSKIEWDLRVMANSLGLGGVEVHVRSQVVELSGIVPSEEAKHTVVEAARRTRGVKSVNPDLRVVP